MIITVRCDDIGNSKFHMQRNIKLINQMIGYAVEQRVAEWRTNALALWNCDVQEVGQVWKVTS